MLLMQVLTHTLANSTTARPMIHLPPGVCRRRSDIFLDIRDGSILRQIKRRNVCGIEAFEDFMDESGDGFGVTWVRVVYLFKAVWAGDVISGFVESEDYRAAGGEA